ncbi:MAG TPA: type II secretion system protein [Thermoanaerobaculia bacterium]|jgi:general secretion pathway protein G|nr:type II secretion system protein [Thermoanaerobaculia bacterium]
MNAPLLSRMRPRRKQGGFTLMELIVVVTIVGILAAIAVVNVRFAQRKAREAALMDNLYTLRKAIDNFYADKQRYPQNLDELVPNYIRRIPADPITQQVDWEEVIDDPLSQTGENGEFMSSETDPEAMSQPGVVDVKSVAKGTTLNNVPYSEL